MPISLLTVWVRFVRRFRRFCNTIYWTQWASSRRTGDPAIPLVMSWTSLVVHNNQHSMTFLVPCSQSHATQAPVDEASCPPGRLSPAPVRHLAINAPSLRRGPVDAGGNDRRKSTGDVITRQNRLEQRPSWWPWLPRPPASRLLLLLPRLFICPSRQRNRIPSRLATACAVDVGKLSTSDRETFHWTHVKRNSSLCSNGRA